MPLPLLAPQQLGRPRLRLRNPIVEGKLYVFRQKFWDVYAATVATLLAARSLFQAPRGQAFTPIGGAATSKTLYHTNMAAAGQFPSPEKYAITGLGLSIRSDCFLADAQRFLYDTMVDVLISGRTYWKSHAFQIPQSGGLFGGSTAIVSNGWPSEDNQIQTHGEMGEIVEQQQTIQVDVDPSLVSDAAGNGTFTTTTTANGGLGINAFVILDGLLYREIN